MQINNGMDALFGFNLSKEKAYQGYGRDAAHHILYTVVNSVGMNGYVLAYYNSIGV